LYFVPADVEIFKGLQQHAERMTSPIKAPDCIIFPHFSGVSILVWD
jgi:hypothetical protein